MWTEQLTGEQPAAERIPRALDAWARYVHEHPYAPRMFFVETTGEPEIQALHREVQAQARVGLGAILGREPGPRASPAPPIPCRWRWRPR